MADGGCWRGHRPTGTHTDIDIHRCAKYRGEGEDSKRQGRRRERSKEGGRKEKEGFPMYMYVCMYVRFFCFFSIELAYFISCLSPSCPSLYMVMMMMLMIDDVSLFPSPSCLSLIHDDDG